MSDKATPRPWKQEPKNGRIIVDADGNKVATCERTTDAPVAFARARRIVYAVSAYDALVGALKQVQWGGAGKDSCPACSNSRDSIVSRGPGLGHKVNCPIAAALAQDETGKPKACPACESRAEQAWIVHELEDS